MATRVIVKKLGAKSLESEVRDFVLPLADKQLFYLSQETINEIRETIKQNILREGSTGKLASSFIAEKISEGYGIGRIDYLNQIVPYWHWQNYGIAQSERRVPPITIGHFDGTPSHPSPNAIKNQKFIHDSGEGNYLMIPTKPIEAKNFIEKTIARIPEIANKILSAVK